MLIDPDTICQIGIVVKDIEKTAGYYSKIFGLEMPEIFSVPPQEETDIRFRGKPTATRARICLFKMEQLLLELIEPDEQPSSWKEFLEKNGEGVHHIGFRQRDKAHYEEAVAYFEENGMPVRHTGIRPRGSYAYMESAEKLGVILNLKFKNDD
jgi:methylmalonyl-CoA/ethylmalonyl-CoA epimerase